jgi:hypothetical protein
LIPADILGGGGMRFRRSLYYMISSGIDVNVIIPMTEREIIHIASLGHIYKELKNLGLKRLCILDLRTFSQRLPILKRTLSNLELSLERYFNTINDLPCIQDLKKDVSLIYTTENYVHILLAYRLSEMI